MVIRRLILCLGVLVLAGVGRGQDWQSLAHRADSLSALGQYAGATAALIETIPLAQSQTGAISDSVAVLLETLGKCHYRLADYSSAEQSWKHALDIREQTAGPNSVTAAKVMNNLAVLYKAQGRYKESEALYRKTLEIRERALGPDDPDVAASLNNLANLLLVQARYAEAEEDYQRALDITERSLGEEDVKVAISLNNLAALYHMLGRYEDEEPLYRRSLEIMTKVYGPDHEDVAQAKNNLGYMFHDMGKYEDAEPLYQQALAIEEKAQGTDHPKVAATLSNLARLYTDEKKYDIAELYVRRALAISEKTQGPDHPEVAEILKNLGDLLQLQDRNTEAESDYQRSMAILEKAVGKTHPLEAGPLFGLAMIAKQKGDFAKAKEYELRAFSIRRKNFSEGFAVMAERNALEYSRFFLEEASNYLSILLDSPEGEKTNRNEIARVVLSTKGQVSDGIFARHKSVSAIAAFVDSLNDARQALSKMYVQGADPARPWAHSTDLSRAAERKERLESGLAKLTAEMKSEKMLTDIELAKVSAALPAGSALIDIMRYDHHSTLHDSESRYLAVVIKSGGRAMVIPLGSAAVLDSAVVRYREHFRSPTPSELTRPNYSAASEQVSQAVWRPLELSLSGVDAIYLAPDGMLGTVSFAGLLSGQDKFLIEQYSFHYLLSGRDLLQPLSLASHGRGLLAMGDPDYNATASSRAGRESSGLLAGIQSVMASMTPRNVMSGCRALRDIQVARLPGTRLEVERLTKQWTESRGEPVVSHYDSKASEENLKRECHGKRTIHLATHGYYIAEECRPEHAGPGYVGESPLLQSGIFLAGANLKGQGATDPGMEDGIVTAEEVANLNLQGTELVILSACETGSGQVRTGEGVFGLRRAFQMAGSQTVISALWSVDDESTSEMIGRLFEQGNVSISDAMRNAALKRISALRNAGRSDDPFFWAAFVATGEWRNR